MWAVVPAAGRGERFGADLPKQYAKLGDDTVIMQSLLRLASSPHVEGICVVLAADDAHWPKLESIADKPLITAAGGDERVHSVLAGLRALPDTLDAEAFVMIHDAARPCVTQEDIDALVTTGSDHPVGALLAAPVVDTVKFSGDGIRSHATLDRSALWRALTPQIFRRGELEGVLEEAIEEQRSVTDEASAMEYVSRRPLLIYGSSNNIKITTADDLKLAQALLRD